MRLAKSRLHHCDSNGVVSQQIMLKFAQRKSEVERLVSYVDKVKKYIKENKKTLLKERSEVERQIFQIQVNNNPKLKDTITRK